MKPILRFNFNPSKLDQVPVLKLYRAMDKYQQGEGTMWVIQRNKKDKERKFERKVFRKRIRVGWCVVGSRSFGSYCCCRLFLLRRLCTVVTVISDSSMFKLLKESDLRRGERWELLDFGYDISRCYMPTNAWSLASSILVPAVLS